MPRGGARPNTGPKPGFDKLRQHERLREMVAAAQDEMAAAQIAAAKGMKYLVSRNKRGGKFTHLTKEGAEAILSGKDRENEVVEEWEKLPNVNAFMYLMDQTIGKPKNVVEADVNVTADAELLALLAEGRARLAKARKR